MLPDFAITLGILAPCSYGLALALRSPKQLFSFTTSTLLLTLKDFSMLLVLVTYHWLSST